jgi:hypothetical protein
LFGTVFLAGSGILALLSGLLITYAFRYVLKHLRGHLHDFQSIDQFTEIQSVYKRLYRNYYVCGLAAGIVGIALLLFAVSNSLDHSAFYILNLIRVILPIFGAVLTIIASNKSRNERNDLDIDQDIHSRMSLISTRLSVTSFKKLFSIQKSPRKTIVAVLNPLDN